MTRTFRRKTNLYTITDGTINKMEHLGDKANQERALECDIKTIIEKYGVMPIELLNRAKEPLFLDNLDDNMTMNERLQQKNQIDDYFDMLPAKVRKEFNDDKDKFYTSILMGQNQQKFEDYGIIEKEQWKQLETQRTQKQRKIYELENTINNLKEELKNEQNMDKENSIINTNNTTNSQIL